jgi:hypothetical protein
MEGSRQLSKRMWRLSNVQRFAIVLCAGLYLLAFRPWSEGHTHGAASVYAGATAMVVLAVLPARMRLISAVALAIMSAFVVLVATRAIGVQA